MGNRGDIEDMNRMSLLLAKASTVLGKIMLVLNTGQVPEKIDFDRALNWNLEISILAARTGNTIVHDVAEETIEDLIARAENCGYVCRLVPGRKPSDLSVYKVE